jgi:hypothetical protein
MDVTLTKDNNITTGKIYSVRVTAWLSNKAADRRQGADSLTTGSTTVFLDICKTAWHCLPMLNAKGLVIMVVVCLCACRQ